MTSNRTYVNFKRKNSCYYEFCIRTFARSGFPTEGYADAGTKWVK